METTTGLRAVKTATSAALLVIAALSALGAVILGIGAFVTDTGAGETGQPAAVLALIALTFAAATAGLGTALRHRTAAPTVPEPAPAAG
ncbi:hypothetical protein [Streptomyces sp. NPDC002564]|uniref:hypothetical protein n=1 Tax=Streptomyces sp. NPDC002564 TaxID=3364649 RepID=UPI0036886F0F